MASKPQIESKPQIQVRFDITGDTDYGYLFTKCIYKGLLNKGYTVKITLSDTNYGVLTKLIEDGYFTNARINPIKIKFKLLWSAQAKYPEGATKEQEAIITSMRTYSDGFDRAYTEFTAIDPPSYYLNQGDGSGKAYKGKLSSVIKSVVNEYAPKIKLDIDDTSDSDKNTWWLLRQDPKNFIINTLSFVPSFNKKKTNWMITPNNSYLSIKEQGNVISKYRAYYRYWNGTKDTIRSHNLTADNYLSILDTKIVTQGLSTISGRYFDNVTDKKEEYTVVKDSNTETKQTAKIDEKSSFKKPPDDPNTKPDKIGATSIISMPELYSAGDIGLNYKDYIDSKARSMWLKQLNSLVRMTLRVPGHGEWSNCDGLGIDTIYINWFKGKMPDDNGRNRYFISGNWIVYGFKHEMINNSWNTDLYCVRFDQNAKSKVVGSSD